MRNDLKNLGLWIFSISVFLITFPFIEAALI